jgi:hypothetical protein
MKIVSNSSIQSLSVPKIYAYTTNEFENTKWVSGEGNGLLKVGFTTRDDVEIRIKEQFPTVMPVKAWKLKLVREATNGKTVFTDRDVHKKLLEMGRRNVNGEWFECNAEDVDIAIQALQSGSPLNKVRKLNFKLRPEQEFTIKKTSIFFQNNKSSSKNSRFLWNAKMRFGKTFTTYKLAEKMKWQRILILTWKPAVVDSWENDLLNHSDFTGWQFIGGKTDTSIIDKSKPIVWFASFQDVLGKTKEGKRKPKINELAKLKWDVVVLDEYHFGAWNENSKNFYLTDNNEVDSAEFSEEDFPLMVSHYLYLSGTPFRALSTGEFIEDQVYSWTYSDEQEAKRGWQDSTQPNPYQALPQMSLLTYRLPEDIRNFAEQNDENEFDLNEFFKAEKSESSNPKKYSFIHEGEVQKWLNLIRGQHLPYDARLSGASKNRPPIPFEDLRLLGALRHTLWYLPSVAACHAMAELLKDSANSFFSEYSIVVAAGSEAGIGVKALVPVREAIGIDGTKTRSITLTCSKLNTGVTVPEWSGILMLSNISTPETYFQTAFRVQSPWTVKGMDSIKGEIDFIIKPNCYIFDFAPNRALRLISEYASQLDTDPKISNKTKLDNFLNYLPVLCYDGFLMQEMKAESLLDFVLTGTSSNLLARTWQSRRLVNVTNSALARLLEHPDLLRRLEKFEAFRKLGKNLEKTINSEKALKKLKSKPESERTKIEKQKISDKEKSIRSFREKLQDKLRLFASRVPVFMYLTDYREETLKDVITKLEPELFEKVTNLSVSDFELLCDIGIFNVPIMDSAVYQFRRFEDASLNYIYPRNELKNQVIGGFIDSYASRDQVIRGEI